MGVDRNVWPPLVQLGLWGLDRTGAWVFLWLSLALAAAGVACGFLVHPLGFLGAGFVFAALWYYLAIRWVDENSKWS
jgi:hypothetical protein